MADTDWRGNDQLEPLLVDIDSVSQDPNNANTHPERNLDVIEESIRRFGQMTPIVVGTDGVIRKGNGTHQVIRERIGWSQIAVLESDLPEEELTAYALVDNKSQESSIWNDEVLAGQLASLKEDDWDLHALGWDDSDLEGLSKLLEDTSSLWSPPPEIEDVEPQINRADELQEKWGTETGQLWQIESPNWVRGSKGWCKADASPDSPPLRHLVLCGDSTDGGAHAALWGDTRAKMVLCDPPYGVEYVGKTKDSLTIQNDGASGLGDLLERSFGEVIGRTSPGACWYVAAPAGPQFLDFAQQLTNLGVWRQTICWVKNTIVMGRSDYHYQHEAIFYGWTPGAAHQPPPDRKQSTIWEFDKPAASREHPTMKPVGLFVKAVRNSSDRGDRVFDPFLGSGTTLVACEQEGREGRGIELSPGYVAVILERMQGMGCKVSLASSPAAAVTESP